VRNFVPYIGRADPSYIREKTFGSMMAEGIILGRWLRAENLSTHRNIVTLQGVTQQCRNWWDFKREVTGHQPRLAHS